jgi:hypothetical protein
MEQESEQPGREVFQFEGDEVSNFTAQIPAVKLEAPEAYPRGTYMTLQLQVRVKSVRLEEDRKGDLVRNHVLALEECTITESLTPDQRRAIVEAAERAAQAESEAATVPSELQVEEEPGPDAAYRGHLSRNADPELLGYPPSIDSPQARPEADPRRVDEDEDDPWDDDDLYAPGELRVELVETH